MSEQRGRGGGRGGGRGEHRGGRGGGRGNHEGGGRGGHSAPGAERPKKENILDLGKYMDKQITVKFTGGREGTISLECARSNTNELLEKMRGMLTENSNWNIERL